MAPILAELANASDHGALIAGAGDGGCRSERDSRAAESGLRIGDVVVEMGGEHAIGCQENRR